MKDPLTGKIIGTAIEGGLIINFGNEVLKKGIKRVSN